ncbi:MAG: OmpA family protein [Pyrinomonadaceae bacterium]
MALFDSIIKEVREKFEIGDQADRLLGILLAMIADRGNGGFSGFLERFEDADLGDLAASWVNVGANMPISYEQTESVFGEGTLTEMANEVGLDYQTSTSATALITPHVVDELTPTGELPSEPELNQIIGDYLKEIRGGGTPPPAVDTIDRIGTAAVAEPEAAAATLSGGADEIVEVAGRALGADHNSLLRIILPLIVVGLLVAVGYMFCTGPSSKTTKLNAGKANANTGKTEAKATPEKTAEPVDSRFTLRAGDGRYFVSGVVKDETVKKQIMDALTASFGEGNVDFAGLQVNPGATGFGAGWWDNLSQLLPDLKEWKTGELSFSGNTITAAADLPQTVIDRIKALFGEGWILPVSIAGAETAAKQANEESLKELSEADTVGEIVRALNISVINFASGSSDIPPDAQPVLQKAAEILKSQPAGTLIEIGGHTDSDGADDANLKLSQARAGSVRTELIKLGVPEAMLAAKGYGEANPVAPNDSPDNKFRNRRIEYKVISGEGSTTKTESTESEAEK